MCRPSGYTEPPGGYTIASTQQTLSRSTAFSVAKAAAELLAADAAAMASMTVAAVAGAGAVEWRK